MNRKRGFIVLGGHVQGYGIVRICGENDIPCIVIDINKYNIARYSKYCEMFYHCIYDDTLTLLLQLKKNDLYKNWTIIPTDDYYVKILSQNKEVFNNYYNISVDEWDKVSLFFNKRHSYPLAKKAEVPTPLTYYPNSLGDVQQLQSQINYPCIIKPAIMKDFYKYFKRKVFICNNSIELNNYYLIAIKKIKPEDILIQEIIPGSSEHQYSVGIFFDKDKVYNYIIGKRSRQHPLDFGNATTFAETEKNSILFEYAFKILKKADIFGIFEVEFKYDVRDGQYKFLEVNPRFWKWHIISQAAGVPFLNSLYSFFTVGKPILTKDYKEAKWKDIITDIPVIIKMILKNKYIKKRSTNLIHAVWNYDDPLPFIMQIILLPFFIISRR